MDYPFSGEEVGLVAAAECLTVAAVAAEALVVVVVVVVLPLLFPQSLSDAVIRSGVETHSSDNHGSHSIVKMALMESPD